jgi:hypothetical protein
MPAVDRLPLSYTPPVMRYGRDALFHHIRPLADVRSLPPSPRT